ncbi:MAG: RNA 2',3'-cyclic phosphodiesterase [Candidatus Lokiarchaeota archaeon]|nr:RNA 2',3'-cyclic phosphodiesterase [Candidatus Lokiarchaeota archaeon]
MIRSFIALELKEKGTIENISSFATRLKKNQTNLKLVKPENLHMTVKFLGNISESLAPKIYDILKTEINEKFFQDKEFKYYLKGVGQFNRFSVIWVKLVGDISFLQTIKDSIEDLLNTRLTVDRDKRTQFKPHLTIGRLRKEKINYKTFDIFKKLINENKNKEFGDFNISQIKLKKSVLTSQGPHYSDLEFL